MKSKILEVNNRTLFIGDWLAATEKSFQFDAILSIVSPGITETISATELRRIEIDDTDDALILPFLDTAANFIHSQLSSFETGHVLVHCQQGVSRSSTVCLAYLCKYRSFGLEDAFDFLRDRHPSASYVNFIFRYHNSLDRRKTFGNN